MLLSNVETRKEGDEREKMEKTFSILYQNLKPELIGKCMPLFEII